MALEHLQLDQITEPDLQALVDAGVPEGLRLEYKRDLYGNSDRDIKEFLKDVSSFANSLGGDLIVGIHEEEGVARVLEPLRGADPDKEVARLESLLRDGIEPRMASQVHAVRCAGGFYLVVRTQRSWLPPHRLNARGSTRMYGRSTAGTYELGIDEMRDLFGLASTTETRVRQLRTARLAQIASGGTPIELADGGNWLILLIYPFSATSLARSSLSINQIVDHERLLRPMLSMGWSSQINFDGYLVYSGGQACRSYTQIYRDGRIEAVQGGVVREGKDQSTVFTNSVESAVLPALQQSIELLRELAVAPPFVVSIALQGVKGAMVHGGGHYWEPVPALKVDELELPEFVLQAYGDAQSVQRAAKPSIDALWNAAGLTESGNLSADGTWVNPRSR